MVRVVLENIGKGFVCTDGSRKQVLDGLDLTLEPHSLRVLLGPSGAGKTTALRILAGLEAPERGRVSIGGRYFTQADPEERDVSMVFQGGALYPHLTVYENLTLGLRLRKVPRAEWKPRVAEIAQKLELDGLLERFPAKLSGGETQRVALGRALVRRPKVLLLDEPLTNLDPPLRRQLRGLIAGLPADRGPTVLYVTHDQEEAMSQRVPVSVLLGGKVQQTGLARDIFQRPVNLEVAKFFGSPAMTFFPGTWSGNEWFVLSSSQAPDTAPRLRVDAERFPASGRGRELLLGLRGSAWRLAASSAPGAIAVRVLGMESAGWRNWVRVRGAGQEFLVPIPDTPTATTTEGAEVWVQPDPAQMHFFDARSGEALG